MKFKYVSCTNVKRSCIYLQKIQRMLFDAVLSGPHRVNVHGHEEVEYRTDDGEDHHHSRAAADFVHRVAGQEQVAPLDSPY